MKRPLNLPHQLTTVRLTIDLPRADTDFVLRARMTGENPYVKDPLWRWEETWSREELADGLDPVDTLRWLLTIATTDHPNSQEHWGRQVTHGEGWQQLTAFPDF